MLKKLFPFLFKKKANDGKAPAPAANNGQSQNRQPSPKTDIESNYFGLIARNKNHRGLRKGSKVYVRQLFEDGDRLKVRGTAPNGRKVTLSVHRKALKEYKSEAIPAHLEKHYNTHSMFSDEHEARVKAEVLNKP